jgi:hypothetical protein
VIANNTIQDCGAAGVGLFLGYDRSTESTDVLIRNNRILGNVRWAQSPFKGGITIAGGAPSNITISANLITDSGKDKTQAYGVEINARVVGLKIDKRNNLLGNKTAPVEGAKNCADDCELRW